MTSVRIVEASDPDFAAFLALAAEVEDWFGPMVADAGFHRAIRKAIDRGSALVAFDAAERVVAGLLFSNQKAPEYDIRWLVVSASRRSEGIGEALIGQALLRWVRPPAVVSVVTFRSRPPWWARQRFLRAARVRARRGRGEWARRRIAPALPPLPRDLARMGTLTLGARRSNTPRGRLWSMIVVVEGPSAAGKTTWCNTDAPQSLSEPGRGSIDEIVRYQIERWHRAIAADGRGKVVVLDGDPFKLYYSWASWRVGHAGMGTSGDGPEGGTTTGCSSPVTKHRDRVDRSQEATRRHFVAGDYGLADLVLYAAPARPSCGAASTPTPRGPGATSTCTRPCAPTFDSGTRLWPASTSDG
jgi:GNAT superfamily N-acetyltransferase